MSMISLILYGRGSCYSQWIQWETLEPVICSKSHQVWYALVPETGLLTIATNNLLLEPPVQAIALRTCSWYTYIFFAPQGVSACLSIALISNPRAPAGLASTCSNQRRSLSPGSSRPFVLRACSSCWEQVAGKAGKDRHQGIRLEG
jgi:hypothetical protein